jgi:hypothetical protein
MPKRGDRRLSGHVQVGQICPDMFIATHNNDNVFKQLQAIMA